MMTPMLLTHFSQSLHHTRWRKNWPETTYVKINAGNLVIDSFLSNYITVAKNEGIQINTDINIHPDQIPVNDYDLCVILGNLLDNSLEACRHINIPDSRYINIRIYVNDHNNFIIHTANTYCRNADSEKSKHNLQHDFGLANILY